MMQEFSFDSGIYLLEFFRHKPGLIEVGAKGKIAFPPGYYYYVGTAQSNLNSRIRRHREGSNNKHWHIDYLAAEASLQNVYAWPLEKEYECKLADALNDLEVTKIIESGFGASDCSCNTHLYFAEKAVRNIKEYLEEEVIN